jgi:hypothetical protein
VYYWFWIWVIPRLRGYRIRQEVLRFEDGAQSHKLIKVPVSELKEWDAAHDAVGRSLDWQESNEVQKVVEAGDAEKSSDR